MTQLPKLIGESLSVRLQEIPAEAETLGEDRTECPLPQETSSVTPPRSSKLIPTAVVST